jgi:DNA-binding response OmpR family regulator
MTAEKTILLADDDEEILSLIEMILDGPGVRLIIDKDGSAVASVAERERPDLILLDVHLPGKSGGQVLTALRENDLTRRIPVIVMTGGVVPGDKIDGFDPAIDATLAKPFEIQELKDQVEKILK